MRFSISAAGHTFDLKSLISFVHTAQPTFFAFPSGQPKRLWRRSQLLAVLHDAVEFLVATLASSAGENAFAQWQTRVAALYGEVFGRSRMRAHGAEYAKRLRVTATASELVFALHTTYGLLARALVIQYFFPQYRKNSHSNAELICALADNGFYHREFGLHNFLPELWDDESIAMSSVAPFTKLLEFSGGIADALGAPDWQNILTALYQAVIPGNIRHDLGEFFTPDWLAEKTMALAGFNGQIDKTVFDPGCGSGSFLLAAAAKKIANGASWPVLLQSVCGCDLNPLSVLAARLNFLVLLSKHFTLPLPEVELPILHHDSVFQTPLGNTTAEAFQQKLAAGCDYLVGNPPWISWNCLPPAYRQKLESELLPQYVLFDFHGQAARLGHSNDDYLSTFTLITVHRYLRQSGLCSFLIKQPLLTNVSGKTFRHFSIRHRDETIPLRVVKAADLRALDPFAIANETAILVLEKGAPTIYPVAYEIWSRNNGHVEIKIERAQPAYGDDMSSPWIIVNDSWAATKFLEGDNPYEIRHGLKHDAADILIVDVVEKNNETLRIKRREDATAEIYEIESNWVFPFLQPRHLQPWGNNDCAYFVLPQHKAGEDNEAELRDNFPLTYAFLKRFAARFAERRSRVFLHKPFYGLFGLGKYTFAPYKVCWVGLGFQPKFMVAEERAEAILGNKSLIPDGTIYYMPFADRDTAHFVCALLNSNLVRTFLSARSGKSKRGLSKKVVAQLALPPFNRADARHVYLAQVSLQLHAAFRRNITTAMNFEDIVMDIFHVNRPN